ncbi:hypothetical protein ACVLHI_002676 [Paenibacillus sp. PvR053]
MSESLPILNMDKYFFIARMAVLEDRGVGLLCK